MNTTLALPGRILPTGLELPDELTFEEWRAAGELPKGVERAHLWWLGDWLRYGERRYGETYTQALDATEFSYQTLRIAKFVAEKFQLFRRLNNLSWSHHAEVARLMPEQADALLEWAVREQASTRELRAEVRFKSSLLIGPVIIPPGKYRTIICDPPWPMQKIEREVRPNQVGFDYPTMSEEELLSYTVVDEKADSEAHLWLWTTQKFLPLALRLIDTWGFDYLCTFVWHKPGGYQPVGLPQYNCEFVVMARRGGLEFIDTKALFTCFDAARREHSRKPDEFYEMVRRVSPEPRIDMFSREARVGFDQHGIEPDKFTEAA
jgi:N6-adenosine-specific RNA methylase IME4